MAVVAVTNTFSTGAVITAAGHNTNFSDIVTWLNNHYNGTDTWLNVKVSATAGNPVDITGSASTTELSINNTATDGDPEITFKLSSSQTHVIGVDDSDSDFLKCATTSITTNVAFQIPTTGAQVQFNTGTVTVPGVSFIGSTTNGLYLSGTNTLGFTTNGVLRHSMDGDLNVGVDGAGTLSMSNVGTALLPSIKFTGDPNTGIWHSGADQISVSCNGVEIFLLDKSAVATNTRMAVWDVDGATLKRVSVGSNDSGGAGFKLLRVAN